MFFSVTLSTIFVLFVCVLHLKYLFIYFIPWKLVTLVMSFLILLCCKLIYCYEHLYIFTLLSGPYSRYSIWYVRFNKCFRNLKFCITRFTLSNIFGSVLISLLYLVYYIGTDGICHYLHLYIKSRCTARVCYLRTQEIVAAYLFHYCWFNFYINIFKYLSITWLYSRG